MENERVWVWGLKFNAAASWSRNLESRNLYKNAFTGHTSQYQAGKEVWCL